MNPAPLALNIFETFGVDSWVDARLISLQIFSRNRIFCTFLLPKDVYDPPTIAIVKQLYAVDSAYEWFGIVYILT